MFVEISIIGALAVAAIIGFIIYRKNNPNRYAEENIRKAKEYSENNPPQV